VLRIAVGFRFAFQISFRIICLWLSNIYQIVMREIFRKITIGVYGVVALSLLLLAAIIITVSLYNLFIREFSVILIRGDFVLEILQTVGAVVIAVAIIDVAKFMIEEEVFKDKEMHKPREARETLTKIMVIISIAVAIEGLVYIVKAGTEDIALLIYPAALLVTSTLMVVGLGIFLKLSYSTEKLEDSRK